MAEELDDKEFFQQDFTTASDWELFNARLEEIFHDWKLPYVKIERELLKQELYSVEWDVREQRISFTESAQFIIKRFKAKVPRGEDKSECKERSQAQIDLVSLNNNFNRIGNQRSSTKQQIHPLAQWYGLRDFVVIEPSGLPIINESQFRVLLSSCCIAVAESSTEIPVFVQIMAHSLNVYLGVCESPSMRINFDIIALDTIPPTCKYLSGLLFMFKAKIGLNYLEPVMVSVRLTYPLNDFVTKYLVAKRRVPFTNESEDEEQSAESDEQQSVVTSMFALPGGVSMDPVKELILQCSWPEIAENVVMDSPTYSDFEPGLAPCWSVRAFFRNNSVYYLSECVGEYLRLCENSKTLAVILGSGYDYAANQNPEGSHPLDLLTESKIPSLTAVLPIKSSRKEKLKAEGPLRDEDLMQMLYYMFPDAQGDATPFAYENTVAHFDPLKIKSASPGSLVCRLANLLATNNSYFGGVSAVAHLWAEFTQEMRYRVERCIQIPGIAPGFPDSRTCLLHQKLQMLNVCIERRTIREGGLPFSFNMTIAKGDKLNSEESEEDEYFDCDIDDDQQQHDSKHAPWNKPEGRRSRLGDLTLIDSTEPLYVPVTQEPVPKTEDQLEDDAEVMLKLGPGSELCAQMMSASLLSDMESFKAANPNGKLEDFIRWYSPRDWIEDADENDVLTGHLSQRMLIPNNTWQTVWKTARPVSARRQKRLFDDTKEAEKVLHFLETRNIGQICELTISSLYQSAFLKIQDDIQRHDLGEQLKENIEQVTLTLCKLSRENWISSGISPTNTTATSLPSPQKWENLLNLILNLERLLAQAKSIILKLFEKRSEPSATEKQILLTLLNGLEADLPGGAKNDISLRILHMFTESRSALSEFGIEMETNRNLSQLPDPASKEYILRVDGKTVDRGYGGPQFMRTILDKHLRICGAFSENITFI